MIEIHCPKCESLLEVDEGFRGGVCRCFECGALLTVPHNTETHRPEALHRPDTPDEDRKTTRYTTTTGRVIELTDEEVEALPIAVKPRMGVRVATGAVIVVVTVAIVAGAIWGMIVVISGDPPPDPDQISRDILQIDRNPYLVAEPSFMAVPVGDRTAIVLDGSAAMSGYLDFARAAVMTSMQTLKPTQAVQAYIWSDLGPTYYPEEMTPSGRIDRQAMSNKLESVLPGGAVAPVEAFKLAAAQQPELVIMLAGEAPSTEQLAAMEGSLTEAGARLVAILIDQDSAGLRALAEDTGGQLLTIRAQQLQNWYTEYQKP